MIKKFALILAALCFSAPAMAQLGTQVNPLWIRGQTANGGLLPAQVAPITTRTTVTASTAQIIDVARSTRYLMSVQLETVSTGNVYLCFTQTTACSATNYDIMIAANAGAATMYTSPFGFTGAIYIWTTGTPIVSVVSWATVQ